MLLWGLYGAVGNVLGDPILLFPRWLWMRAEHICTMPTLFGRPHKQLRSISHPQLNPCPLPNSSAVTNEEGGGPPPRHPTPRQQCQELGCSNNRSLCGWERKGALYLLSKAMLPSPRLCHAGEDGGQNEDRHQTRHTPPSPTRRTGK